MFVLLAMFVTSIIYFETEDIDPSSFILSLGGKLEGLFGPPDEKKKFSKTRW